MGQNFIACDRRQVLLMPPDLTDWVAEDHLVWSILGAVEQMNLGAFYGAYRQNGQGRVERRLIPARERVVVLLVGGMAVGLASLARS